MEIAAPLMIVGQLVAAGGTVLGGLQADAAGKATQKQYDQAAGQERAMSQRQAEQDRLQARLAESRGIAVAAASGGGGVETRGVADTIAGINEEGEMRALTSLWEGEERARSLEYAGKVKRWEGKNAKTASFISAGSQVLQGAASFAGKYGGGK